ncbi:MAG: glycosyltransferase [Prevotella sp.]|nr:glycosyltransferase [Prevotella sp.]
MSKKLYFATEARFIRKGNKVYGGFTNKLWDRYLAIFDEMIIIARVRDAELGDTISDQSLASSEKVSFMDLPYYIGYKEYLKKRKTICKVLRDNLKNDGAYLCRIPGQVGNLVINELSRKKIKYGCEIVGDPWEVMSQGDMNYFIRQFIRGYSYFSLKRMVKGSSCNLYVTEQTLQTRYPSKKGVYTTSASNVMLRDNVIACEPHKSTNKQIKIISIGSLEQMYKSPDVVLEALSYLRKDGYDCYLTWLGDGRYKEDMINLAESLHIKEFVNFVGNVDAEEVWDYLRESNMFVLASITEGLPRAMIEAMSQGLPCIGTEIGGITELIEKEMLVKKKDVLGLVKKIEMLLNDKKLMWEQACRNLEKSYQFKESILSRRREEFYQVLSNLL